MYFSLNQKRPYNGKTRKEIKEQMLSREVVIKNSDIPKNWSPEAADFINKVFIINKIYQI